MTRRGTIRDALTSLFHSGCARAHARRAHALGWAHVGRHRGQLVRKRANDHSVERLRRPEDLQPRLALHPAEKISSNLNQNLLKIYFQA